MASDRQGHEKFLSPAVRRVQVGELLDGLEADFRLRKLRSEVEFRAHLKPIRAHFGIWRAADLTAEAIDAYIEQRLEADEAPATMNQETQVLGQAMRLALERETRTARNPGDSRVVHQRPPRTRGARRSLVGHCSRADDGSKEWSRTESCSRSAGVLVELIPQSWRRRTPWGFAQRAYLSLLLLTPHVIPS